MKQKNPGKFQNELRLFSENIVLYCDCCATSARYIIHTLHGLLIRCGTLCTSIFQSCLVPLCLQGTSPSQPPCTGNANLRGILLPTPADMQGKAGTQFHAQLRFFSLHPSPCTVRLFAQWGALQCALLHG